MASITGTMGDDNLVGTDGDDVIEGLGGNDIIDGRFGSDTLLGGQGSDIFDFNSVRFSTNTTINGLIDGGTEFDTINFSRVSPVSIGTSSRDGAGQFFLSATVGSQRFELRGIERVLLGSSDNFIELSQARTSNLGIEIYAGEGNDRVTMQAGVSVFGDTGNDVFFVSGGFNEPAMAGAAHGGSGTDILRTNILFNVDLAAGTASSGTANFTISGFEILLAAPTTLGVTSFFGDDLANTMGIEPIFAANNGSVVFDGRGGDDLLSGGKSNDSLTGGSGNDILTGGGGSDWLNGGAGFDTALYSGLRKTYAQTKNNDGHTMIGFGPEGGTDTLVGIEEAVFVDGKLTFDANSTTAKIMRLYDATFRRAPDPQGLEHWQTQLSSGLTLNEMSSFFAASPEFLKTFGSLSNLQFVEQLYVFALGRTGDKDGVQGWVNNLDAGASRGDVLLGFSESQEHVGLTAVQLAQGLWISDKDALVAARMYDSAFGRLPDTGVTGWINSLRSGLGVEGMAAAFISAPEFITRFGNLTDREFVEQLYQFTLDRAGEPEGVQGWVNFIAAGGTRAQVLAGFSESGEHVSLTAPLWYNGISLLDQLPQSHQAALTDSAAVEDTFQFDPDALVGIPGVTTYTNDLTQQWDNALRLISNINEQSFDSPMIANAVTKADLFDETAFSSPVNFQPDLMEINYRSLDHLLYEFVL